MCLFKSHIPKICNNFCVIGIIALGPDAFLCSVKLHSLSAIDLVSPQSCVYMTTCETYIHLGYVIIFWKIYSFLITIIYSFKYQKEHITLRLPHRNYRDSFCLKICLKFLL